MGKFKALIFDLDGTAVKISGMEASEVLKEALGQISNQVKVSTATGRIWNISKDLFKQLGLTDPCVVSGGSQIVDPRSGQLIWEKRIPNVLIRKVLPLKGKFKFTLYINEDEIDDFSDHLNRDNIATIYFLKVAPKDEGAILGELAKFEGLSIHSFPSWSPGLFDMHITDIEASKKHGIEELIRILGITKEETIGVGDAINDEPLFESVGFKVAMGNATEDLKKLADFVAPSVDEDGLAYVINKFIL